MDAVLEALAAFEKDNVKPNPEMTKILRKRGYIKTSTVTHFQSPGQADEYIATGVTDEGEEALRKAGLMPVR